MIRTTRQIYTPAILLAVITLAALLAALLGNDILKTLSCLALSIPLLILADCILRSRSA